MAAAPRGRGYALQNSVRNSSVQPLRRPGESGLKERFGTSIKNESFENNTNHVNGEDKISLLCNKIGGMNLSNSKKELQTIETDVNSLCDSLEKLQSFVDRIVSFALKTKWNSHAIALFCENFADVSNQNTKLRTLLLKKLQNIYLERNKAYQMLENFLLEVTFFCEVFYHVKINDACIQVLANPVIELFGMLIDGGTIKEIEVFYEQFPKCFHYLRDNNPDQLEALIRKIRKQLVGESTSVTVRARLLEMFEMILTDWRPLNQEAKHFYDTLLNPIIRICE